MKKKKMSGFIFVLIFFAGLSLLLYPSVANLINKMHGSKAISDYSDSVSELNAEEYEKMIGAAREYNRSLIHKANPYFVNDSQKALYEELLNIGGNGVMGYIEIPAISVMLPVYHGTDENTLQKAVGHLDWTSLPVGGESSHCVLSGHRGLPSAMLFTNLDKLVEGDVFMLRVLNEVLTYEVDQILIVLPQNSSDLQIALGEDYCTLVTCTPYGINSHRLLVRGHRIENEESAESVRVISEAVQIDQAIVASVLALPTLILMLIAMSLKPKRRRSRGGSEFE